MATRVNKTLAGVVAALAIGVAVVTVSSPAVAFDPARHDHGRLHHFWRQGAAGGVPYRSAYVYAYGEAPRNYSGYYFTSSNFCVPNRNNGYNGGFANFAYDGNGRFLGYVCR
jgi:hypothetical protein